MYSRAFGLCSIFVSSSYVHVGSVHADSNSILPEAKHRASSATAALKEVHVIIKSCKVDCKTRCSLVRSLATSRLSVNIAVIGYWQITATRVFDACYYRCFRSVFLSRDKDGKIDPCSNSSIRAKHGIISPSAFQSSWRLRYFTRFLSHAPSLLISLVSLEYECSKTSWLSLIMDDFRWMQSKCPLLLDFPDPGCELNPWISFVKDMHSEFRKQLLIACDASCFEVVSKPESTSPLKELACSTCGHKFSNVQELGAHIFSQHGVKSGMRLKSYNTVCSVCCKDFRSRTRLHNHLAYRALFCGFHYASKCDIPMDLFKELEAEEHLRLKPFLAAGRSKLYYPLPTVRISGPIFDISGR